MLECQNTNASDDVFVSVVAVLLLFDLLWRLWRDTEDWISPCKTLLRHVTSLHRDVLALTWSTTRCGHMLLQVDEASRQQRQSSGNVSSQIRASLQPKVQAEQSTPLWNKANSDYLPPLTMRKSRAAESKASVSAETDAH